MAGTSSIPTKEETEELGAGTIVLSIDSTKRSPSVIVKNSGVTIVSNNPSFGITVDDNGVTIQGQIAFSSVGKNITKGMYSENNKSPKPFTYEQTLSVIPSEEIYNQLAPLIGSDVALQGLKNGFMLYTDIAPGPTPHMHTISAGHKHAIEPAYLYRLPTVLTGLRDTLTQLEIFFASFAKSGGA